MKPLAWARDYFRSLTGRIALLLTLGIAGASILSLFIAERVRTAELRQMQLERLVLSSVDMAQRFTRDPAGTERSLHARELFGVRTAVPGVRLAPASGLQAMLRQRLGPDAQAAQIVGPCFPGMFNQRNHVAGMDTGPQIDCWQVSFRGADGVRRSITLDLQRLMIPRAVTLDPLYLALIVVASALLSIFASRLTAVPLRRLTEAARRFSLSIDPEAIPEIGPAEVRSALATFNLMQERVREGFRERTHILAGIAHDLQTPLTRLRLRLEDVEQPELRDKLVTDLAAIQAMVRSGLDLARSSESREPWSVVEIGSLLDSLVEDAIDTGAAVTLEESCAVAARVKPDALTRCLSNIIDNAVKYGGRARIRCRLIEGWVEIDICDDGPGLPEGRIDELFEPFFRGESHRSTTGGTGIGLTIARAQARTFGATLILSNRTEGGALARVRFPTGRGRIVR